MDENIQEPLSEDLFEDQQLFTEASSGSRFLNFLIDNLFMNFVFSYAMGYLVGFILSKVAPDFLYEAVTEEGADYYLLIYIVGIFDYVVYYTICEKAFNGYTIGKIITGTRAVRNDGQSLTLRNAFLRSLSRLVPFEVFSALGARPWHDTWTGTTVIKAR